MNKFGRIFDMRISVEGKDENIHITNPLTLSIDITRNSNPTANVAQFKIYNLSKSHRDQARFDISSISSRQEVALKAGYRSINKNLNDLPLIFRGSISYAYSERQGTDWVTTIECYDGGFAIANSKIEASFLKGEKYSSSVEKVLNALDGIAIGKISESLVPKDETIARGHSHSGKIFDILNENFGNKWFIDNGVVNIIGNDEALNGMLKVVNSDTGLLGTPVRQSTNIDFDMVFEPRLLIGQLITLESSTDPSFNGTYKLISIKHRGIISDSQSGELITSCRVFKGTSKLEVVK